MIGVMQSDAPLSGSIRYKNFRFVQGIGRREEGTDPGASSPMTVD
jgi:hypothetical protein